MLNNWRTSALGLKPKSFFRSPLEINGNKIPVLYGYSSGVLPKPSDWDETINVSGYWFLDQKSGWQPPQDLLDFLADGPPPVYIGFGSMVGNNSERLTEEVAKAVKQSKHRFILATGWGGLQKAELPDSTYFLDYAPHDWLLSRVSSVVHHGGAGTTAAGLRYGKPTFICPFMADQTFWGNIINKQGLGPEPVQQNKLTTDILLKALQEITDNKFIQDQASKVGQLIQSENGTDNAVSFIQKYVPVS